MNRTTVVRVPRRKNPVAAGAPPIHSSFVTESPIKAFVVSPTGEQFKTICVQQDDGSYVAVIEGRPRIRHSAKTRDQAETGVRKLYMDSLNRKTNPILSDRELQELQDEDDNRVVDERKRSPRFISLEALMKKHGIRAKN